MMRAWLLILSCLLSVSAFAGRDLYPIVRLISIDAKKTLEKNGDELYMAVTAYPSKGQPTHTQVPSKPTHWLSQHLDQVTKVKVWNERLKDGEAVTLLIALVEQDTPPWNTDDLIGEVRLYLMNKNGRLISKWSIPNRSDGPTTIQGRSGRVKQFELIGEGARYFVYFDMKLGNKKK